MISQDAEDVWWTSSERVQ